MNTFEATFCIQLNVRKNMSALKSDNRLPKVYLKSVGKIIITVNMKQPPLGRLVYCKEARKPEF